MPDKWRYVLVWLSISILARRFVIYGGGYGTGGQAGWWDLGAKIDFELNLMGGALAPTFLKVTVINKYIEQDSTPGPRTLCGPSDLPLTLNDHTELGYFPVSQHHMPSITPENPPLNMPFLFCPITHDFVSALIMHMQLYPCTIFPSQLR